VTNPRSTMKRDEWAVSAVNEVAHDFVPCLARLAGRWNIERNLALNNFGGGHFRWDSLFYHLSIAKANIESTWDAYTLSLVTTIDITGPSTSDLCFQVNDARCMFSWRTG
jgi:hypothetical protein